MDVMDDTKQFTHIIDWIPKYAINHVALVWAFTMRTVNMTPPSTHPMIAFSHPKHFPTENTKLVINSHIHRK